MPDENDMPNKKNMLLIEAYRIQVERWNKRRDIEWRLTLTLWSTIVIITFALAGKIELTGCRSIIIGIIYIFLFLIYCFWIHNLWKRNDFDKERMYNYQEEINNTLNYCDDVKPDDVPQNAWADWSARSQLCFTFLILFFSILIMYLTPKSEPSFLKKLVELIERNIR